MRYTNCSIRILLTAAVSIAGMVTIVGSTMSDVAKVADAMNQALTLEPTYFSEPHSALLTHAFVLPSDSETNQLKKSTYEPDFQQVLEPESNNAALVQRRVYGFVLAALNSGEPSVLEASYQVITERNQPTEPIIIRQEQLDDADPVRLQRVRVTPASFILRAYIDSSSRLRTVLTQKIPEVIMVKIDKVKEGDVIRHRYAVFMPEELLPTFAQSSMNDAGFLALSLYAKKLDTNNQPIHGQSMTIRLVRDAALNVLVLGDSVVWGQGLKLEDKFTYKVFEELARINKTPIRVVKFAHSGAVIKGQPIGEPCPSFNYYLPGEIPRQKGEAEHSRYRIDCQINSFEQGQKRFGFPPVDLVLLDGCANDVDLALGMAWIAAPMMWIPETWIPNDKRLDFSEFTSRIYQYCGDEMERTLRKLNKGLGAQLSERFWRGTPRIVVTGYYDAFAHLGPDDVVEEQLDDFLVAVSDNVSPGGGDDVSKTRQRSHWWKSHSDKAIADAVKRADPTDENIKFAPVDISYRDVGHENSGNPWENAQKNEIWGVRGDDMMTQRKNWCPKNVSKCKEVPNPDRPVRQLGGQCFNSSNEKIACEWDDIEECTMEPSFYCTHAAVIHPNKKGALVYADAISKLFFETGFISNLSPTPASVYGADITKDIPRGREPLHAVLSREEIHQFEDVQEGYRERYIRFDAYTTTLQ